MKLWLLCFAAVICARNLFLEKQAQETGHREISMVFVIRLSVALLVSSIVSSASLRAGLRLRFKGRFTLNATDTSRVTATVLRYLLKPWHPDSLIIGFCLLPVIPGTIYLAQTAVYSWAGTEIRPQAGALCWSKRRISKQIHQVLLPRAVCYA
jgi:hypothetical protein